MSAWWNREFPLRAIAGLMVRALAHYADVLLGACCELRMHRLILDLFHFIATTLVALSLLSITVTRVSHVSLTIQ